MLSYYFVAVIRENVMIFCYSASSAEWGSACSNAWCWKWNAACSAWCQPIHR